MKEKLIGREKESHELQRCLDSNRSELVIVYGRRRIGKTFLIEQFFNKRFDFWFVGVHGISTRQQLRRFAKALKAVSGGRSYQFADWFDAFDALQEYLLTLPDDRKKTVFIDEMPWMDSGRSGFVSALENFWNGWAMSQENIMLIATGSATSWMRDKLVANKGGLHGRITCQLHLSPFTLHETEMYLNSLDIFWDRQEILEAYMILGGVPFYYSILESGRSLAENIDNLFFSPDGQLKLEFDELFSALFSNADVYQKAVKILASNRSELTHSDISKAMGKTSIKISSIIKNLERCGLVERWSKFGNKKREEVLRLVDFYCLFYYKFIHGNNSKDPKWWSKHLDKGTINDWMGNTFELVCICHHEQIKAALGLSVIATDLSTWRSLPDEDQGLPGAQIDLIIERADRTIHLCEMKFSREAYVINKEYEKKLRERAAVFKLLSKTKSTIVHTFVTTYGVLDGKHKSIVHSEVTMDDLFNS